MPRQSWRKKKKEEVEEDRIAWLTSPESCISETMKELEAATFWKLYFFKGPCKVLSK